MIDYNAFHSYLVELVALSHKDPEMRGMSGLAQDHHCAGITKAKFYRMGLDRLQPEQITPQFSRVVRDSIGKSDAISVLREAIGALNGGILANSRISQGSDRTVQITITQPVQPSSVPDGSATKPATTEPAKPTFPPLPNYRVGQVLYWGRIPGGMLVLVSRILSAENSVSWDYTLYMPSSQANRTMEKLTRNEERLKAYIGDPALRPAKGSEVARFLGALTREGYLWEADNTNGLFTVKGRRQSEQSVEVFANDIPMHDYGDTGIYSLPAVSPSPYRFALGPLVPIDNGDDLMSRCYDTPMLNAVVRQIRTAFPSFDHIRELFEYDMPTLCCSEEIGEYRVALVKDDNNGTCYWLARDRDVLRLLSWISFIV